MGTQPRRPATVRAAGVVPWRVRRGRLQVALVHRPRYDDWSWPKGKLDPGEEWVVAAVRETLEETGLRVRLGLPLPEARYPLDGGQVKRVRYWAGTVHGGHGRLEHEIDDLAWLPVDRARTRLSYARDREQLEAVAAAHDAGRLDVRPLLLLRHAEAVGRGSWTDDDRARPLSRSGVRRARELVDLLAAWAPTRLLSSPSVRCAETLRPYAEAHGIPLVTKRSLSEEGYADRPTRAVRHLERLLAAAEPSCLCTHGPVLPALLRLLADRADPRAARRLRRLAGTNLDKGEVLVCSVTGSGDRARVVAVERHRP